MLWRVKTLAYADVLYKMHAHVLPIYILIEIKDMNFQFTRYFAVGIFKGGISADACHTPVETAGNFRPNRIYSVRGKQPPQGVKFVAANARNSLITRVVRVFQASFNVYGGKPQRVP